MLHGRRPGGALRRVGLTAPGSPGPSSGAEERLGDGLLVVLDPVDGSTNASLGIPWYATSICVLDAEGPRVALVVNQASGVRLRGGPRAGARRDGATIAPSGCRELSRRGDWHLGLSLTPSRLGASSGHWVRRRWTTVRWPRGSSTATGSAEAPGSTAGTTWGECCVCTEAGAVVDELDGEDLVVRDGSPRSPVAAASPELLAALLAFEG